MFKITNLRSCDPRYELAVKGIRVQYKIIEIKVREAWDCKEREVWIHRVRFNFEKKTFSTNKWFMEEWLIGGIVIGWTVVSPIDWWYIINDNGAVWEQACEGGTKLE